MTDDEAAVLLAAKEDFSVFFQLIKVLDKDARRMVHPVLRNEQETLVEYLLLHQKVIVGKPRQIGATTVVAGYFAWCAYFDIEPLQYVIVSLKDSSVRKIIKRVAQMLAGLPLFMRRTLSVNNEHEIRFADTGASIYGYAAGGRGGARSDVAAAVLLTEFAWYPDQDTYLTSIDPMLGNTGQLIIETTASGPGNKYHTMVMEAARGVGSYQLCFFPFTAHTLYTIDPPPGFKLDQKEVALGLTPPQAAWRRMKIADLGSEAKFRQEYPLTPSDAFVNDDLNYFSIDTIDKLRVLPVGPPNVENVYAEPDNAMTYGVVSDIGGGVKGDFSTIMVIDVYGTVVYWWTANTVRPRQLADLLRRVAEKYNDATILAENNLYGEGVNTRLAEWGCKLYSHGGKRWTTSEASKLAAYTELEAGWLLDRLVELPLTCIQELQTLVTPIRAPEAPRGQFDDAAMTCAMGSMLMRKLPAIHAARVTASKKPPFATLLSRLGIAVKQKLRYT